MKRLTTILLLSIAACVANENHADVEEELMAVDRAFAQATAARGIDGWMEFFADSGMLLRPGGGLARDAGDVRAVMTPALTDTTFSLTWDPQFAVAAASADLGYTVGRYERRILRPDGDPVTETGRYVTIWQRQSDGRWKVVLDTGQPDAPPGPPGPPAPPGGP